MAERKVARLGNKDRVIVVAPARYVTIELFSAITGYSEKACDRKREDGVWLEGKVWVKSKGDGRILYDLEGYYKWVNAKEAA